MQAAQITSGSSKKNNKKKWKKSASASCNFPIQHYINSIEDGEKSIDSSRKREGTEPWTYGLMIKLSAENGLTLN